MPLDSEARTLLDQMAAAGGTPVHLLALDEARQRFRQAFAALAGPPVPVAQIEGRIIPTPDGPLSVRLYQPDLPVPLPVLVWFHAGGWTLGDLETTDSLCRALASDAGCLVVSVDYRLAPEYPFPAAFDDAEAAVRAVAARAGEWGGDTKRLAVGGESAGGNLAAVTAIRLRATGGPPLIAQLLVCPVTDYHDPGTPSYTANAEGYFLTRASMKWFWGNYLPVGIAPTDPRVSPLHAPDLAGLPPALVVTAEYDPLRDEGEAYAVRLRAAGVPTLLRRYPGTIHCFLSMGVLDRGRVGRGETAAASACPVCGHRPAGGVNLSHVRADGLLAHGGDVGHLGHLRFAWDVSSAHFYGRVENRYTVCCR